MKRKPTKRKAVFASCTSDKELISELHKRTKSLHVTTLKIWALDQNRKFSKDYVRVDNITFQDWGFHFSSYVFLFFPVFLFCLILPKFPLHHSWLKPLRSFQSWFRTPTRAHPGTQLKISKNITALVSQQKCQSEQAIKRALGVTTATASSSSFHKLPQALVSQITSTAIRSMRYPEASVTNRISAPTRT